MIPTASPRPSHYQWPCRVDAETDEKMSAIQRKDHDDKSGVVRHLIALGIETYEKRDRDFHALDRAGLSIDSILPYIGDPRGHRRARGERD
jgi:hypothetical protein